MKEISDNNWAKMSRQPKPSTKKMILDELEEEEGGREGRPNSPSIPLVGSMNVPISATEEEK